MISERLYLDFSPVLPDWEAAKGVFRPSRGVVVVEMLPPPEKIGGIWLPETAQRTRLDGDEPFAGFEPSVAVVLASDPADLHPGMAVLVRDGDGLCVEGVDIGGYRSREEVRFFGRVVPDGMKEGYIEDLPWDESVVAEFDMDENRIKTPLGANCVIRRDDLEVQERTESGLYLPESMERTAPCMGVITHTGPRFTDFEVGEKVLYHPEAFVAISDNLRIVHQEAIISRINA